MNYTLERLPDEPAEAFQLFDKYCRTGENSLKELSIKYGVPLPTIKRWFNKYDWNKRRKKLRRDNYNTFLEENKEINIQLLRNRQRDLLKFDRLLNNELDWIIKESINNSSVPVTYSDLNVLLQSQLLLIKNLEKINSILYKTKGGK